MNNHQSKWIQIVYHGDKLYIEKSIISKLQNSYQRKSYRRLDELNTDYKTLLVIIFSALWMFIAYELDERLVFIK